MGWWGNLRSRVKAMPKHRVVKVRYGLSFAYFFAAWNALALAVYAVVKHNNPQTEEEKRYPSKYYARLIGTSDAKVYRFSGFKLEETYEIPSMVDPNRARTYVQFAKEEQARLAAEEEARLAAEEKAREDLNLLVEVTDTS